MKLLLCLLLAASPLFAFAQSDPQFISLEGARAVHIYAAFSSVSVTTGGTDAIKVAHTLMVDGTDRPDLRHLTVERTDGVLYLREVRPTAELLRAGFSPTNGGRKNTAHEGGKEVFNKFMVDAVLNVVVPAGIPVTVATKYGGIEAVNVGGLLSARARYGAVKAVFSSTEPQGGLELYSNYGDVDVTIPVGWGTDLDLTTEYGELITDPDVAINENTRTKSDFYENITGEIGRGGNCARIRCEAPYGDVYLRSGQ